MTKKYQLINTEYFFKQRGMNSDKVLFILKDKDGNKIMKTVEKPIMKYYITKPQYWNNEQVNLIPKDKVVPVKCYYKDIYKSIIQTLNDDKLKNYFHEVIQSHQDVYNRLRSIHLDYRLHKSDFNIQDYYIREFLNKYPYLDNDFGLSKCFFDIEVDSSGIKGFPQPEEARCPINVITLCNMNGKNGNFDVYSFCLKYDTDNYKETMKNGKKFIKEIKEKYNSELYKKLLDGHELKFHIYQYQKEENLIAGFFKKLLEIKPDFLEGWNSNGFDYPYIYNRVINLGYNPEDIMCPPEFKYKKVSYRKDIKHQDPANNNDTFKATGYTNYMDAERIYAVRRKNKKEESYALDYIGNKILGIHKDDVVESIKTFHFKNYWKFLSYNIQDTVMLMLLEYKLKDLDMIYSIAMMTGTRIEKAMKKTTSLRNLSSKFYEDNGQIISNNRAILKEPPDGKIRGGFVGNILLIDNIGMKIAEALSQFMFENCIDFDARSLYPSTISTFNISPETCIGKLKMMKYDRVAEVYIDKAPEFVDDYTSDDVINFGHKWFELPSLDDYINDILEDEKKEIA